MGTTTTLTPRATTPLKVAGRRTLPQRLRPWRGAHAIWIERAWDMVAVIRWIERSSGEGFMARIAASRMNGRRRSDRMTELRVDADDRPARDAEAHAPGSLRALTRETTTVMIGDPSVFIRTV